MVVTRVQGGCPAIVDDLLGALRLSILRLSMYPTSRRPSL